MHATSPPFVISDDNDSNSKNWAFPEQEDASDEVHGDFLSNVDDDSPTGMLIIDAGEDGDNDFPMELLDSLPTEVVSALCRSGRNIKRNMLLVAGGILLPLITIFVMSVYFALDRHYLQQQHEALREQVEVLLVEASKVKQVGCELPLRPRIEEEIRVLGMATTFEETDELEIIETDDSSSVPVQRESSDYEAPAAAHQALTVEIYDEQNSSATDEHGFALDRWGVHRRSW